VKSAKKFVLDISFTSFVSGSEEEYLVSESEKLSFSQMAKCNMDMSKRASRLHGLAENFGAVAEELLFSASLNDEQIGGIVD